MLVEIKTVYELTDIEGNRYGVYVSKEAVEEAIEQLEILYGINRCVFDVEEIPLYDRRLNG